MRQRGQHHKRLESLLECARRECCSRIWNLNRIFSRPVECLFQNGTFQYGKVTSRSLRNIPVQNGIFRFRTAAGSGRPEKAWHISLVCLVHTPTWLQRTTSTHEYFYFRMEVSQLYSTSVQRDELRGRVPIKALRILEASSQNCEYKQKHIAESVNAAIGMRARYYQDMQSKQRKRQRKGQLRIENGTKS